MNEDILRSHFGFNDPNVIRGILNDPAQVARYTREYGGGGTSISGGNNNGFDTNAFLKAQQDRQDALLAKQRADTEARFAAGQTAGKEFIGRFNAAIPGLYETVSQKYGVPELTAMASNIKQQLDSLRTNAFNTASGYANQGQAEAAAGQLGTQYAIKSQAAQGAQGLAQNEYTARTAPFEMEAKLLTDRLSREATGYTQEQQNELDTLLKTMESGVQLGRTELDKATRLAELENQKIIAEENYATQLEKTKLINERVRSIGKYGGTYIDENGVVHTVPGNNLSGSIETFS